MRDLGPAGAVRGKIERTTVPGEVPRRPGDLVGRDHTAPAPNRLWVADLTHVATWSGSAHVAFVVDVFSRRDVGWRCSTGLRTDLALEAPEQGLRGHGREGRDTTGSICHSDRGIRHVAIRHTERLAAAGTVGSVGSEGRPSDDAAAESLEGSRKTEVIRRQGPWKGSDDVELATSEWVDRYDRRRLHSWCGNTPPARSEQECCGQMIGAISDAPTVTSLH